MRILESSIDAPKAKGAQTCSLPGHHGQILEAFCTVCKESICQRCALWGHRAHELVPLDGVQDSVLNSEASNVQELVKQCFKYENEAQVAINISSAANPATPPLFAPLPSPLLFRLRSPAKPLATNQSLFSPPSCARSAPPSRRFPRPRRDRGREGIPAGSQESNRRC
jgi:hypothetical protein